MEIANLDDEVQKIAEYHRARKTLRAAGIGGLAFGTLALFMGITSIAQSPLNIILIMIGLLLLVEGIWNVSYPTAAGILVDGVALLLVGAWNIFVTVMNVLVAVAAAQGAAPPAQWGVIGVVQIAYGIYRFGSYRRFAEAFLEKPDEDDLKQLDELVKKIQKTRSKDAEGMISFQAESFARRQEWKGQLVDHAALFVAALTHDVLVARKEEVDFEVQGKVVFGKSLKARFRIRNQNLKGLISPDSLAKYNAWKTSGSRTPTESGDTTP